MIEKTSVTIVRHGETQWNKVGRYQGFLDSPLSDKGVDQVYCLAKALKKFEFDVIYSSDLGRALQTANIIAREFNLSVIEEKRLRERNLGRLQGLTDEEFKEKYPDDFAKYKVNGFDKELFGGESYREMYERSIECFIELADKHRNGNILIVTHGGNLECIFRWVFEIPLDKKRQFSLKNCSINRFFIIDGNWKLDIWGEVVF